MTLVGVLFKGVDLVDSPVFAPGTQIDDSIVQKGKVIILDLETIVVTTLNPDLYLALPQVD